MPLELWTTTGRLEVWVVLTNDVVFSRRRSLKAGFGLDGLDQASNVLTILRNHVDVLINDQIKNQLPANLEVFQKLASLQQRSNHDVCESNPRSSNERSSMDGYCRIELSKGDLDSFQELRYVFWISKQQIPHTSSDSGIGEMSPASLERPDIS